MLFNNLLDKYKKNVFNNTNTEFITKVELTFLWLNTTKVNIDTTLRKKEIPKIIDRT